ncbi:type II DNA topoisomerase [Calocera cornea HHB12733]|uniref:DNA topoisomerase 2 n=1 Tax=Calocera cornea HHB12733 TaxID=1353952 RepID=A0A165CML3_9BASI|nr:type II DNA topoisomerase [Calocera cornea HHB12733]
MSDDEFNMDVTMDDGDESDFMPVTKKKPAPKAAPKPKAPAKPKGDGASKPKAAAKPKAAPKKKAPLNPIDENQMDSMVVDDDDFDFGPAEPVDEDVASVSAAKPPKAKKNASEIYERLDAVEHVLKRPDSYIGSVEAKKELIWVYDSETKRMVNRETTYVPGFFKIVDEILVNAADHKINEASMDTLKVVIDREKKFISVYNNGAGIPVEMHTKERMYIPQLIFGNLFSGSNYDDTEKKLTGGRNGFGAKLANIYSHEFVVETADAKNGKKYKQTWTKNMSNCSKPSITNFSKSDGWTKISFTPDLARFGMTEIDDDTYSLLCKRVYDLAGTVKDIKVFLNDERIKIKGFKQYIDMYVSSVAEANTEATGGAAQPKPTVIYEQLNSRWEVGFALSDGQFQQVSFANSISTIKGGTHVDTIANQISAKLLSAIQKKNKSAPLKAFQVKGHMWLFVNCLVENPSFDSQTKDTLTLKATGFGSRPAISDEFMKKVAKTGIVDNVLAFAKFKADQAQKKTDGTKRSRLVGMAKLVDANNAGGRNAAKCTLILTEGDSAKTLAEAGLAVVGRDNFGIFPLRGKLLNVREANHDQIMKNAEIQAIKKIMGLQHNKVYDSVDSLRYGSIMIMTDQDHDGSHIKGLIINFLDHFYPSLLKIPGFLVEFVTPIVRLTHKRNGKRITFFTMPEYEEWSEQHRHDAHLWQPKYYKGLGTSGPEDGMEYFGNMETHLIPFHPTRDGERELIDMAFSKKKVEARKDWLRAFKPGTYIDHSVDEITYDDFINKELILFSMADNIRSIPSMCDGLKPGQRKVLFGTFKRKLRTEIKVAQLSGYIGEHTQYHHGEQSLHSTIIGMAQNFVGANNLNLLLPSGGFGSRSMGGEDSAAARYLNTNLTAITRVLFHPADDNILTYMKEDGKDIEPEFYLPIIPMVLVNGGSGIGTGWSTNIPSFNPVDIVTNIRRYMRSEPMEPMVPWYRNFLGTFEKVGDGKFMCHGLIKKLDDYNVEINELPIGRWTQKYKEMLETWITGDEKTPATIKDYKEYHTTRHIRFTVQLSEKEMAKAEAEGLEKYFKLLEPFATTNMMCFDAEGKMKKFNAPEELIEDFCPLRLKYYQKRKDYLANLLMTDLEKLNNQARFVKMIIDRELVVSNRKKAVIVAELRKKDFKPFPKVVKAKEEGETEDVVEEEEEEEQGSASDYDYLLGMAIHSLTEERINRLLQDCDRKEGELKELLKLSAQDLWNRDLDIFLEHWETLLEEDVAVENNEKRKKKVKQGATLKTRKSLGKGKKRADADISDDDFMPTKAAAKPRKPAAPKPTVSRPMAPSKPSPKAEEVGIDSLMDVDSSPIIAKTAAAKGKGKGPVKRSSLDMEDDDDMYIKPAPKKPKTTTSGSINDFFDKVPAAPAKKAPVLRKVSAKPKIAESDEDEGVVPSASQGTRPQRAARAAAPKYVELDPDDEDDKHSVFEISDDDE